MKFSTRIVLAMLAIMLISTSIVSVHSIVSARDLYRQKMNDVFRSTFQGVIGIREAELGVIQARCARLARSPRIFAALQQSDRGLLSGVADDELREFFAAQGETAVGRRQANSYLFLNASNEVIAPGTGLPKLDDAVIVAVKQLKLQPGAPTQRIVYIAFEEQAYEMICTPIDDVDGEGFLGTLALIFDYAATKPMRMADGGEMNNGLLLGAHLYGGQILESNKVAAKLVAAIAVANANRIGETPSTSGANSLKQGQHADDRGVEQASPTELEISIENTDWLTHTYVLNEQVPPAYFVVSASLAPLQKEIQQLSFKYLVAVLVGACGAIVLAFLLGLGLAKPIKQLSLLSSKVAGGDYTGRVTVIRRDELGVLGERFNTMCEGLALRDKYRGVLDAVTDRTVTDQLLAGALDVSGKAAPIAVLFADIRGFTPLTNRLTPHEIVAVLNDHMSAMTDVIYSHGGVVDKFVGDMVMAIFGAPNGKPDDAARAAGCALEMLRVRKQLNKDAKHPFEIGIGVAFGVIIVGCMGSKKRLNYTVLGERVNLAARLCSMAPANTLYIDQGVRQYLDSTFIVGDLPPLKVKGFNDPVQAFELSVDKNQSVGAP